MKYWSVLSLRLQQSANYHFRKTVP